MEKHKFFPEFKGFISGVIGSWCGVCVGQPFDIIKVRLQNNGGSAVGTLKCLITHEGFFTLWKGSLPPLIGNGLASSISFGINENSKRIISSYNNPGEVLSISQHSLCGTISGFFRAFISCPTENIRIRMQIQGKIDPRGDPLYKNSVDCFLTIFKKYGIFGIYKGFPITMLRELIGITMYFMGYQYSGRKLFGGDNANTNELKMWQIMICGGLAGYAYWVVYPIDVVKSKLQSDSYKNMRYKSTIECVKTIYKDIGVKGFFRGFLPAIIRAAPANAAILTGFETMMSIFGRNYR
ncbi:unnamed protein product [Blepharisma stoltei]|uniref:Mitochondrial carrier protein n=1 Tax=Blepharisma stoltei TaxID=1481888 RepID=A0AAU9I7J9_9CILI|nr:unnamed protein product [Blepharisma stoltei]